ncbi:YciI family protein [Paraglaciecola sp.]|uniref:YciI family protein n=1 Tax=Paraglaciecola sp. TaxID=1920173 RepID=UPI0030F41403
MKVMVMIKGTANSEAGELPSQALMTAMGNFNQQLVDAGIMESGEGLKPSSAGFRVRFSGDKRSVMQGPFVETNELIAGYWVWNVSSMDEALEWVKKCPNPMMVDSDIEIRPFYNMEDFAEVDSNGEISAQEDVLRETIAVQKSMQQTTLNNYLFFGGRCEEALNYYKQHIGAKIGMLMRFSDSPEPMPEGILAPGFENKVMHCEVTVGDSKIMASDGCGDGTTFSGFSLAITLATEQEAQKVFATLSDGGQVTMPLEPTFWSPLYGQLIDQFGVAWMVMLPEANNK